MSKTMKKLPCFMVEISMLQLPFGNMIIPGFVVLLGLCALHGNSQFSHLNLYWELRSH